ncbi:MAG: gluconokinase [Caldilineaceae bacterium]|nr:gluconokinase [Caldilineaceae bacterium]
MTRDRTPMSLSLPLILTIDIGTSSTRAILYDAKAQQVEEMVAQRSCQMTTTPDGGAVFDAAELVDGVVAVVDELLERAGELAGEIGAVAVDTLVGNVLGVDEQGQPVTPLFTYADTRNANATQALRTALGAAGAQAAHDRTGCLIHTSYLPSRFRWLAEEQPQWFQAARRWVSIGELFYFQLFGAWRVSYSVASWTGLLNRRDLAWDAEWLTLLPVTAEQLSPLGDLSTPCQGLQGEWAKRWPALAEIPWLLPIGDGAAANIGSGCDAPDRIALTMGTTGAMRVVVGPELKEVPAGLWLYRVDAPRALLGGATTEGGNVFAWLKTLLQLPHGDALEKALSASKPAAHGLTLLPFVAGERAPGWREDARAAITGLSLHTQPIDILQAGLEAIAYRFALIYQRILPQLPSDVAHEIIAGGGGLLSSPAWLQIMADVLGRPLHTLAEKEGTSRGLALLALEQLGVIPRPAALPPALGTTYLPDGERHALHQEALARQVELYGRLLDG